MASVPNTNVFPSVPVPGAPAPAEGEGGDFFASLLPTVAGGTILAGPTPPAAPVTVVTQEAVTQIRPGVRDGAAADDGEEGDAVAPEAADGDDEAIAALFAQAEFVPVVQIGAPVPPVAVTTPLPAAPPADAASIVPEAVRIAPDTQSPAVRMTGVPLILPVPVADDVAEAAPATPDLPSDAPVPQRPASISAKPAARGEALPDELVIPVKTILKQTAAVQPVSAVETAQKAAANMGLPLIEDGQAPRRASRASADKAAAIAPIPAVPSSAASIVMPLVAPLDPLAVARTAPAQRPEAAPVLPAEQAIQHELDLAHESEWLDRLARDIASTGANDGAMRFKLHPQTLGHLKVELTQGDHGTSVRLTVETEAARALLADAQPKLIVEARAQGVRIAQTDIDLSGSGQQAAGDPRRQDDARHNVLIRTARGSGGETAVAVETGRTRADRYA